MDTVSPSATLENRTFDEIATGDSAELVRTLTQDDIDLFAIVSGDVNPSHLGVAFARADPFQHRRARHVAYTHRFDQPADCA